MYVVYVHIFPNSKRYVGITQQKPEWRWSNGEGYKDQPLVYNAIRKYGWHNVEHKILYTNLTKAEACAKEIELIAEWQTTDDAFGYNLTSGGEGAAWDDFVRKKIANYWTPERREQKRQEMLVRENASWRKEKKRQEMLGTTHSDATKQKMREARKAYYQRKKLQED